ncbi:MAG: iron-containing alcohol dehydrogenase [Gaiellaceae bacterium]
MIVRHGLGELAGLLDQLGVSRPFVLASRRWSDLVLPVDPVGTWRQVPSSRLAEIAARTAGADVLVPVGGGSSIDLAKAVSALTRLPVVSIPTTYSGAEWTDFYGVRDPDRTLRGGGAGAILAGIVYDPQLTLELPRAEAVGTALNALAHCAEALYVRGRNAEGDRRALAGAGLISQSLPRVVEAPASLDLRAELLLGAMHAGQALAAAGLGLGHAMAQALGGRYGLSHGALNAICLPLALRFNAPVVPAELERFGAAMAAEDPIARVQWLARLGGFGRLRDLGVPAEELDLVAADTAARPGARANPRRASPGEIAAMLRGVW